MKLTDRNTANLLLIITILGIFIYAIMHCNQYTNFYTHVYFGFSMTITFISSLLWYRWRNAFNRNPVLCYLNTISAGVGCWYAWNESLWLLIIFIPYLIYGIILTIATVQQKDEKI